MKALVAVMLCGAISMTAAGSGLAEDSEKSDKVTLEFRLAEEKPAEGLTEHAVPGSPRKIYLHPEPGITNRHIENVVEDMSLSRLGPEARGIAVSFTDEGAKLMETMSEEHMDRPIAILIDGKVVSAPIVRAKITNRAVITGRFSDDEIQKIVNAFSKR